MDKKKRMHRVPIVSVGLAIAIFSAVISVLPVMTFAQEIPKDVCRIVDGKLVFYLDPGWSEALRRQVVREFNLDSAMVAEVLNGLPQVSLNGVTWDARKLGDGIIELSKAAGKLADIGRIQVPVLMLDENWFSSGSQKGPRGPVYGINRFKKPGIFSCRDSVVTLNLPGYSFAGQVFLSGSFNNWSTSGNPLSRTDDGWTISLKLGPGHYTYKYIVDGRWTQDPNNKNREDDLNGGYNSAFYCYNYTFSLDGYTEARKVNLAGSFNGFNPNELEMIRSNGGWILPMYLETGTHSYKFVVDGRWMTDPANPRIRGDGRGNLNSFMSIGDTLFFRLEGFTDANQVELAGSFNNWQWGELMMEKTGGGWELPYVLAPGNHEYKYIIDGRWTPDPGNPYTTGSGDYTNSLLVLGPNHVFVLDSFPDARQVIVAGSFNDWQEDGYRMARQEGRWVLPLRLYPGKYNYKFIVDGRWILDPHNELWEENEYGTDNSVLWIR